jgi:Sec-independent protein secretion pathway component TatC
MNSPELEKTIALLRETAPEKWEAMVKAVYISGIVDLITGIGLLILCTYIINKGVRKLEDELFFGAVILSIALFLLGLVTINQSISPIMAPDGVVLIKLLGRQ